MATVGDTLTRALREIGVLAQNQTATAFQGQQGLQDIKAMVAGWELDGISLGEGSLADGTAWTLTTELPFPENHTDAIMYNLAVRSAPKYGRTPKETTVYLAQSGYRALQAAYGSLIDMDVDSALKSWRRRWPGDRIY